MTPPDCWVPVPIRWRHVQPGDVVVGKDGRLWHIRSLGVHADGVIADSGERRWSAVTRDPDATATVLIPAAERDALHLTRAELGAQVESRRLNQEQGAA